MPEPSKETYIQAIAELLEKLPVKQVARLYRLTQRLWNSTASNKGA